MLHGVLKELKLFGSNRKFGSRFSPVPYHHGVVRWQTVVQGVTPFLSGRLLYLYKDYYISTKAKYCFF